MSEIQNNQLFVPKPFTITGRNQESENTVTFQLQAQNKADQKKFSFFAGQFNMVYMYGKGEVPLTIIGDPYQKDYLYHTVKKKGDISKLMFNAQKNDTFFIRGPFGKPWPREELKGKDIILIARAIGMAAFRSIIYSIIQNRNDYGKVTLLYGAKLKKDFIYLKEIEVWRQKYNIHIIMSVEMNDENWDGNKGVISEFIKKSNIQVDKTIVFISGNEIMTRYSIRMLQSLNLAEENMYVFIKRNIECGMGTCGHCQIGRFHVCLDGPVFKYSDIEEYFVMREV